MQWQDNGIILSQRPWGENYLIVSILTPNYGRHLGLVRTSQKTTQKSTIQPGNYVQAVWRSRLLENLGNWTLEMQKILWVRVLNCKHRLATLSTTCALIDKLLAERQACKDFYCYVEQFLQSLPTDPNFQWSYLKFELSLLKILGFGLTFDSCIVTGQKHDLSYLSPKSGHAVSQNAGEPYREKLLKLPAFLWQPDHSPTESDLKQGLILTGYFLHRYAMEQKNLPLTRQQII